MRGLLEISSKDDFYDLESEYDYTLLPFAMSEDYRIKIYSDLDESYEEMLSSEKLEKLKSNNERNIKTGVYNDFQKLVCIENEGKEQEFFDNIEYILFNNYLDDIIEFIKKNPIIKTKKIVFRGFDELDLDFLNNIKEKFQDTSNIYFLVNNTREYVSFDDCLKTYSILENFAEKVNKFNFSPLEKIMYVYDFVRDKVYNEESKDEETTVSRDFVSALLGDKIVCAGFAAIFIEFLEKLDIKADDYLLVRDKNIGHKRVIMYIKDEKYGVDGIYLFDPTFDCKRKNDNNKFLLMYNHFGKTFNEMDEMDKKHGFEYRHLSLPVGINDLEEKLEKAIEERKKYENETQMLEFVHLDAIKTINVLSKLVNGNYLYNHMYMFDGVFLTDEKYRNDLEKSKEIIDKCNKPLSANTILKALYNVRKVQYYENPDKYPFTLESLVNVAFVSNFEFEKTPEQRLFETIFDESYSKVKQASDFISKEDYYKDIEKVRLAKILRNVLNSKTKRK